MKFRLQDINDGLTKSTYIVSAGNVTVPGFVSASGFQGPFTGSLLGNASSATSASYAITTSFAFNAVTASYITASNINGTVLSASYSVSASYALNGGGSSLTTGSSYPITASWAITASYAITTSFWDSSSIVTLIGTKQPTITTGSTLPITASYALTSSQAVSSSWTRFPSPFIDEIMQFATNTGGAYDSVNGTIDILQPMNVINLVYDNFTPQTASVYFSADTTTAILTPIALSQSMLRGRYIFPLSGSNVWFPGDQKHIVVRNSAGSTVQWYRGATTYTGSAFNCSAGYFGGTFFTFFAPYGFEYYPVIPTSSYAVSASSTVSSSYALTASFWDSSSIVTSIGTKQATLTTGATYPITASWAISSSMLLSTNTIGLLSGVGNNQSSSAQIRFGYNGSENWRHYVASRHNNASAVSNSIDFYTSDGLQAGVFPTNAIHGLSVTNGRVGIGIKDPLYALEVNGTVSASSYIGNVVSSSYALSASYALNGGGASLATGSSYPITSSWAITSSYALTASLWDSSSIITLIGTKQATITTGSTLPITASWAITASYAISSSQALSASWAPIAPAAGLTTGSTYPITSSWAISASMATTASMVSGSWCYLNNQLVIPAASSNDSTVKIGALEIQPFAVNNNWFGDNIFFNGSGFQRRAGGNAGLFYFQSPEGQFRFYNSGAAGSTVTNAVQLKINGTGNNVALGGALSTNAGVYSGATIFASGSGRVGINNISAPVNNLDVNGNISCSVITASLFNGTSSYSKQSLTASFATSASFTTSASYAVSASAATYAINGAWCWAYLTANSGGLASTSSYGCTVARLGVGQYAVIFNASTSSSLYAVGFNGMGGIPLSPTPVFGFPIGMTTASFTMSVCDTLTSAQIDPPTSSLWVFSL